MRLEDLKTNFLDMDPETKLQFVRAIRHDRVVKKASKAQKVAKKRNKIAASDIFLQLNESELAELLREFE